MPFRRTAGFLSQNLAVTALIFSAVVNTILVVTIVLLNNNRIDDAQKDRTRTAQSLSAVDLRSCKRTYEGVRQIFQPLLPKGKHRRAVQGRIRKFNVRINQLKEGCKEQTATKPKELQP